MLSRERGIIAAALAVIEDPSYAVKFPDHIANWDPLVSSISAVREALKFKGRPALQFTFMLSVTAVCGGPFTPGMYRMLESCLLSEEILLAITKKIPKRKGVGLVATSNDTVSTAW
ncbi:hypothetical protein B0H17DRAFT_1204061 [Mycena rosella]|uniref:Uncharacterized protein n=1 Tax=Mycena rosella TaxID=1033263 RepID=A0AAD7GGF4_MYCRO|nr:hypothetical protein B0H17DRAFT_1204061 [Mycena rosella]